MTESQNDKNQFLASLKEKYPSLYFFLDLVFNIVIIVLLVFLVRGFVVSPFQVFGPSMCNTLNDINGQCQEGFGEYLIVNKALYYPFFKHRFGAPKRGDIVVFRPPHNKNDFYIKRIIGLPGETVKLQSGKVYISNKEHQTGYELPEEYLSSANKGKTFPIISQMIAKYEVPENMYFVLGDNRNKSTDSRTCFRAPGDPACNDPNNHFLPIGLIEGKASLVLWPFNRIRLFKNPVY